jgi:hypothetical protein
MVLLVAALAVLLVPAFFGCRETLPPEPVPDLNPNLSQLPLRPPSGGEPFVVIDTPAPPANLAATVTLGPVIQFGWHSGLEVEPLFVRWLCMMVVDTNGNYDPSFDIVRDLNLHPARYESRWSKWIPYKNPHGRTTMVGEDEPLALRRAHIFAVQAQDHSRKVTTVFQRGINIRQFIVSSTVAPLLTIWEPFLGGRTFIGTNLRPDAVVFPAGLEMNFSWHADASAYGGKVIGYRYGWDVSDIDDKHDWEDRKFSLENTSAPPIAFQSGVHTLYIQAFDNSGAITLGRIEVTIVPFTMERNLLWVDDFPSSNFPQLDYVMPREDEHDAFWLGHCAKATGFDASRDVYDAHYSYNGKPPELSLVTKYKNIIWTYSSNPNQGVWDDIILFIPESMIGSVTPRMNYLSLFLAGGGHLLTEGMSDRMNGLAAIFPPAMASRGFPLNIKCEFLGNSDGCEGDTSSVNSYAYKDYCVTMLDKINATIRTDSDMPLRRIRNYDCMYPGTVKSTDVWHDRVPGMPIELNLWSEILVYPRYYSPNMPSPNPGGFTPVEIYDPAYWMSHTGVTSQGCFHPMYRMKSKNSLSPLNNQTAALWVTKYADVVPSVAGGVAAPSAHFGFELWFFDRPQVNQIMYVIFSEWGITATRNVRPEPVEE